MRRFRDQYGEDEQIEIFLCWDKSTDVSYCYRPPDQEEEVEEACDRHL